MYRIELSNYLSQISLIDSRYVQYILELAKQDTLDYADRLSINDESWLETCFLMRLSKEIHSYYAKMNHTYMLGQATWDYYNTEKIYNYYEKQYNTKQENLEKERGQLWQKIQ